MNINPLTLYSVIIVTDPNRVGDIVKIFYKNKPSYLIEGETEYLKESLHTNGEIYILINNGKYSGYICMEDNNRNYTLNKFFLNRSASYYPAAIFDSLEHYLNSNRATA